VGDWGRRHLRLGHGVWHKSIAMDDDTLPVFGLRNTAAEPLWSAVACLPRHSHLATAGDRFVPPGPAPAGWRAVMPARARAAAGRRRSRERPAALGMQSCEDGRSHPRVAGLVCRKYGYRSRGPRSTSAIQRGRNTTGFPPNSRAWPSLGRRRQASRRFRLRGSCWPTREPDSRPLAPSPRPPPRTAPSAASTTTTSGCSAASPRSNCASPRARRAASASRSSSLKPFSTSRNPRPPPWPGPPPCFSCAAGRLDFRADPGKFRVSC